MSRTRDVLGGENGECMNTVMEKFLTEGMSNANIKPHDDGVDSIWKNLGA